MLIAERKIHLRIQGSRHIQKNRSFLSFQVWRQPYPPATSSCWRYSKTPLLPLCWQHLWHREPVCTCFSIGDASAWDSHLVRCQRREARREPEESALQ